MYYTVRVSNQRQRNSIRVNLKSISAKYDLKQADVLEMILELAYKKYMYQGENLIKDMECFYE